MKRFKKTLLWIALAAIVGSIFIPLFQRNTMKLVHKSSGFVVAEKQGRTVSIKDPFLAKELKLKGISIPVPLRDKFEGKAVVRMGDPLFSKAFEEVYLRLNMEGNSYEWKESLSN